MRSAPLVGTERVSSGGAQYFQILDRTKRAPLQRNEIFLIKSPLGRISFLRNTENLEAVSNKHFVPHGTEVLPVFFGIETKHESGPATLPENVHDRHYMVRWQMR